MDFDLYISTLYDLKHLFDYVFKYIQLYVDDSAYIKCDAICCKLMHIDIANNIPLDDFVLREYNCNTNICMGFELFTKYAETEGINCLFNFIKYIITNNITSECILFRETSATVMQMSGGHMTFNYFDDISFPFDLLV